MAHPITVLYSTDAKPVTRSEPWFNFKANTWLGKKVLKQVDYDAVPGKLWKTNPVK